MDWLLLLWPVIAVLLGVRIGTAMRAARLRERPTDQPLFTEPEPELLRREA